jgi:hypothetical protein
MQRLPRWMLRLMWKALAPQRGRRGRERGFIRRTAEGKESNDPSHSLLLQTADALDCEDGHAEGGAGRERETRRREVNSTLKRASASWPWT